MDFLRLPPMTVSKSTTIYGEFLQARRSEASKEEKRDMFTELGRMGTCLKFLQNQRAPNQFIKPAEQTPLQQEFAIWIEERYPGVTAGQIMQPRIPAAADPAPVQGDEEVRIRNARREAAEAIAEKEEAEARKAKALAAAALASAEAAEKASEIEKEAARRMVETAERAAAEAVRKTAEAAEKAAEEAARKAAEKAAEEAARKVAEEETARKAAEAADKATGEEARKTVEDAKTAENAKKAEDVKQEEAEKPAVGAGAVVQAEPIQPTQTGKRRRDEEVPTESMAALGIDLFHNMFTRPARRLRDQLFDKQ